MKAVRQLEEAGIQSEHYESNPLLPNQPTEKELLGPRKTFFEAALIPASIALPPIGLFFGTTSLGIAYLNNRERRDVEKQLHLKQYLNQISDSA